MVSLLDVATISITGFMVGNELSIAALVHPAISRLEGSSHPAAAKSIASVLGKVMPFWYALGLLALLAELWARRAEPERLELLAFAAALWAGMIVYTLSSLVPLNNRIAAADPTAPYPGWARDRKQWDARHRIRVVVLAGAFLLLLAAVLPQN